MYHDTKLSARSPLRNVQVCPVESGWMYHAAMCQCGSCLWDDFVAIEIAVRLNEIRKRAGMNASSHLPHGMNVL